MVEVWDNLAMFDEPPKWKPELSHMYSVRGYRQRPDKRSRYVNLTSDTITCDECFANQHETGGYSGIRHKASRRRSFLGGPTLNLCGPHAELWKERDEED